MAAFVPLFALHNVLVLAALLPQYICCLLHTGGEHVDPGQMFSTAHAGAINVLQLLMKALTQLQWASQRDAITAALQVWEAC